MADTPSMIGKHVLVTGGTGGIGKATAVGLAVLGARVGITSRDQARGEAAAADIRAASGNPAVDVFTADLSSQAQVRRLAGEVLDAYPRLDVLVNTGRYFANRKPKTSAKASYDTAAAARLWEISADLVGLTAVHRA